MDNTLTFLLVTANENETHAILEDEEFFKYKVERSKDPHDILFYNVGKFGKYNAIHMELPQQGVASADASIGSIITAINVWNPDAVILVGIAFGKDNYNDKNRTQQIGDVLISSKIQDYESGKIKNGRLQSEGINSECGRHLYSVFKQYSYSWSHHIEGRKAKCEFGILLSGDKVCDDPDFKAELFKLFPRAIGGEMEGRGAFAACRQRDLDEWIVIKAICDWGDGTKAQNKEYNQILASKSVVSFIKHVFSDEKSFEKIPIRRLSESKKNEVDESQNIDEEDYIGYFINFGTSSCRLFKLLKNEKKLVESAIYSYEISDPKNKRYLSSIISCVKNSVLPSIKQDGRQLFIKAFADSCFINAFKNKDEIVDEQKKNKFIWDFYSATNLYFNILTKKQTEENLRRQFKIAGVGTAIVSIGSQSIFVLIQQKDGFMTYDIPIMLSDVSAYLKNHAISEIWDERCISDIKGFIRQRIGDTLNSVKASKAIIIKDELTFMNTLGYPIIWQDGYECLSIENYQEYNREILFNRDFKKYLRKEYKDSNQRKRLYGFKNGHIILETIFELLEIDTVIPSDELSIHGYVNAYIFNVAISGSTNQDGGQEIKEAINIMEKLGARVLSPTLSNGKLTKKTNLTDMKHAMAIQECDLLFVCNKNGYIGPQTGCEIYGAYVLNKPIGFWTEPDDNTEIRLSYIPHETWGNIMKTLEEDDDNSN